VHFSIEERLCLLGAYEGQIRRTSLEAARGAALLSQGGAVRSAVRLRSFSVVLDDQYGSTFLLCLPHSRVPASWRSS
jgi:hypothetical protein